ncbi:necrosis inducing protein-domain-containing protein [Microdochium bolleyi]|uniref:Necrosis inducing protein-domain-containing protein n=1 Tax=Microdochium bolleyi TaxID=196109 RepID=A0A136JHS3_9PEZI|nr:necrosis inducing protein-domain-containing protein [Microdochium bolleyi]
MSLAAAGLAILLGSATTFASPVAIPETPMNLYRSIMMDKRDPPRALGASATDDELKFQPSLDFDTDGCYNTPAIDSAGNVAEGLDHNYTGGSSGCRDESDLDNNQVYVRTRCNNGWCAHVYDYYFEKDVAVQHVIDAGGHRHDWEHIIVFTQGGSARIVAASKHGDYDTKNADDSKVRWDGTHPKIVYHKDGGTTHCFRFAGSGDDRIENHKGVWFRGALINWDGLERAGVRQKLVDHDFGSASLAIKDASIKKQIDYARNGGAPGFDSGVDA